ncbi:MAG: hypothetical protein J6K32_08245 [Clostridia bacterium]|nr:hypothetical protein [Clostridia bacterium]
MRGEIAIGMNKMNSYRPKISRLKVVETTAGLYVQLKMKRMTRRRFERLAMTAGLPARNAREMAKIANEQGVSYKKAYIVLMQSIREAINE